jgi:hypothetical protein
MKADSNKKSVSLLLKLINVNEEADSYLIEVLNAKDEIVQRAWCENLLPGKAAESKIKVQRTENQKLRLKIKSLKYGTVVKLLDLKF